MQGTYGCTSHPKDKAKYTSVKTRTQKPYPVDQKQRKSGGLNCTATTRQVFFALGRR